MQAVQTAAIMGVEAEAVEALEASAGVALEVEVTSSERVTTEGVIRIEVSGEDEAVTEVASRATSTVGEAREVAMNARGEEEVGIITIIMTKIVSTATETFPLQPRLRQRQPPPRPHQQ